MKMRDRSLSSDSDDFKPSAKKAKIFSDSNESSSAEKTFDNHDDNNMDVGSIPLATEIANNSIEDIKTELENDGPKNENKKLRNDKLPAAKFSDTDSEDEFENFKKRSEKAKQKVKARLDKDDSFKPEYSSIARFSFSESSSSESEKEHPTEDQPEKKETSEDEVEEGSDENENKSTRKNIRKVIGNEALAETTKQAEKAEKERLERIAERQKKYSQIFEFDNIKDATTDKLVLDFNERTKEKIITVHPGLVKKLKPHQANGVKFMWDACYESVERINKTAGSGCILAHCMGLGKTLQVITLIHTLMTHKTVTKTEKVLIVCPVNTILNWIAEFNKWLNDIDGSKVEIYNLLTCKQVKARKCKVEEWGNIGGVLIIGYDMFRNLTNPTNKRLKKSQLEVFQKFLVKPGADLVVCDEGHLLKNEKSNLSIATNRVHTRRRIILTGTPMQNNLKEYYCMVQFVKPNLLGTYKEYTNRFVNPITNGQYIDSTEHDINVMKKRSYVLHKMLDGIVQRRDYEILAPYLPPKYEYVLFITLSDVQIKLYQHYLSEYSRTPSGEGLTVASFLFADFQAFQRICSHPCAIFFKNKDRKKKRLLGADADSEGSLRDFINDDEESNSLKSDDGKSESDVRKDQHKNAKPSGSHLTRNFVTAEGINVEEQMEQDEQENGWWNLLCSRDEFDNIASGTKLHLLFSILQECELVGEKLLVFSQSLYSLNVIEYFLSKIDKATRNSENDQVCGFSGSWVLGSDYFRMDGSSSCDNRSTWCQSFNNPGNPRARLFLISTRAGGLGINLTGANRVIVFDVSWNPSHDVQSIYRVYRFGQTKPCHVYRFVTNGTMEMTIYERQVTKQALSKRVIDEQQIDRHYNQNDLAELYKFNPKPNEQPILMIPKDVILAELLQKENGKIFKYHEHQTLLENKEEEELNENERRAAWREYESEKNPYAEPNSIDYWLGSLPLSAITTAITAIVQKDNPTLSPEQIQSVVPMIVQQLQEHTDKGNL